MPRFTYVSRDERGQKVTAVAEAATRQTLLGQLKDRGLTVVEIERVDERAESRKAKRRVPFSRASFGGITGAELAIFWRELATMVAAGLPVVEALESISEELEHARLRSILTDVTASMWEGLNLSQSIKRHP